MAKLELRLLGLFQAILHGKPITGFESSKVRALLAYLAAETRYPQPRESLAGLLWPDWPQQSAMSNLRYALADLRKNIADRVAEPSFLLISREAIQFNLESDCWVDVGEFVKLSPERISGAISFQPSSVGSLRSAVELYRGEFMQGFSLPDSPAYEEWLLAKREYLSQQMLKILSWLVEKCIEQGDFEQAEGYARRQIELEPWREKAHQQLMRALSLRGERVQALAQFESLKKALRRELTVEPSEETLQLYVQIRDGKVEARKETVIEVETPIPAPAERPTHNLPASLSSFVGREKEIEQVRLMMAEPTNHLVTLTGSGGVGKTRLALRVAQEALGEYPEGVWLVELASISNPDLVFQAVASVFGVQESKDVPLMAVLANSLRPKRLLLVLDNCEHLVEACASLAGKLLQACPNLQILATSREVLGVEGESYFHLPSLAFPDPNDMPPVDDLCQYEGVCLFIERAQAALPGFTATEENSAVIVRICQRLDGIPLAIELAAARVKLLGVEQIAARLEADFRLLAGGHRTALPRQQTVRASIEWSYRLLSEAEQALLRRLSVFTGGWSLEASEALCKDDAPGTAGGRMMDEGTDLVHPSSFIIHPSEVLDLLTQLVNKSLVLIERVQDQGTRYRLLEMVRQYTAEQLAETGEAELAGDRHLAYFLHFAEEIEPALRTAQRLVGLERLRTDLDNLRAALSWSLDRPESEKRSDGLRLGTALGTFWESEGFAREGLAWLEKGLTSVNAEFTISNVLRAKVLNVNGILRFALSDFLGAHQVLEECVALFRQIGDSRTLSWALISLAVAIRWQGDYITSYSLANESVELARQSGDSWILASALSAKGSIAEDLNDHQAARSYAEQSLARFQEIGDRWSIVWPLKLLGNLAQNRGDYETTRSYYQNVLAISRDGKNKMEIMWSLTVLGDLAYLQGDYSQMEKYFQECLEVSREIGFKAGEIWSLHHAGIAALCQGRDQQASRLIFDSLILAQGSWETQIKEGLNGMAGVAVYRGQHERAARLFGAAEALYANVSTGDIDQNEREKEIPLLRTQMNQAAFQAAWDEGRGLTLEQAIQEAKYICS